MDNPELKALIERCKAEILQIDINQKNLLIISYPPGSEFEIEPESFRQLSDGIDRWMKDEDDPIYILGVCNHVEIKLEKVKGGEDG